MSSRYDILAAKEDHDNHVSEHKCGTLIPCTTRAGLWRVYMDVASKWGQEPGDESRQAEQYRRIHEGKAAAL